MCGADVGFVFERARRRVTSKNGWGAGGIAMGMGGGEKASTREAGRERVRMMD